MRIFNDVCEWVAHVLLFVCLFDWHTHCLSVCVCVQTYTEITLNIWPAKLPTMDFTKEIKEEKTIGRDFFKNMTH